MNYSMRVLENVSGMTSDLITEWMQEGYVTATQATPGKMRPGDWKPVEWEFTEAQAIAFSLFVVLVRGLRMQRKFAGKIVKEFREAYNPNHNFIEVTPDIFPKGKPVIIKVNILEIKRLLTFAAEGRNG